MGKMNTANTLLFILLLASIVTNAILFLKLIYAQHVIVQHELKTEERDSCGVC